MVLGGGVVDVVVAGGMVVVLDERTGQASTPQTGPSIPRGMLKLADAMERYTTQPLARAAKRPTARRVAGFR